MSVPFSGVVPPALPSWPPDQSNVPPCPNCNTPMQSVPYFRVNLLGPRQIIAGAPAVEIADVVHTCPTCRVQVMRRFQAPPV